MFFLLKVLTHCISSPGPREAVREAAIHAAAGELRTQVARPKRNQTSHNHVYSWYKPFPYGWLVIVIPKTSMLPKFIWFKNVLFNLWLLQCRLL